MANVVKRMYNKYKARPGQLGMLAMALVVACGVVTHFVYATGETVSGSSSVTTQVKTAYNINDIVINGADNSVIPVKLLVTNGTLAMSTTTGLTFTGPSTGSVLYFSGTRSDVNTALATLTYTRNTVGTDTLEISLVPQGEVFLPENGHLYEYVSATLTWGAAKTAAEGRTKYGATGYLATITSQSENDFVSARLSNAGWMGASDAASEGAWKWVTGPENGTQFWQGLGSGSTVGGNYANWNPGEPNDSGANEDCGQFLAGGSGMWNDLPCSGTTLPGYVVEYGSGASLPTVTAKNISITTVDTTPPTTPGTPSTTSPTTSLRPVWSWSASTDAGVGLTNPAYSVQWSQSATFASGVSSGTTNSTSFTQPSNLTEGTWYFRVQASDTASNNSSYSANGTVVIDLTGPTAPGLSATTVATYNTTPTLTWNSSTTTGAGLANPAYTVQWSQSATFASGVSSATTNNNYYTLPSLANAVWYVRVRAADTLANTSAWSPTVIYIIDTVAPSTPGTPSTATPTNSKRPTWTWASSSDSGSGLYNPAYTVQWSQSATFASGVSSATTNSTSYTHTADLAEGTWYFRVTAQDAASNDSAASTAGSVVIDITPAALSAVSADSIDENTQRISWTSDKLSSSLVQYGPTVTYDSTTSELNTSPRVTAHEVTLANLVPCTLYHYQVKSVDGVGNIAQGNDGTFITTGCAGTAQVIAHADDVITTAGGSISLNTGSGTLTVDVPANFSTQQANFQIKQINTTTALAAIGAPIGKKPVGDTYDIKALEDTLTTVSTFAHAVRITIPYTASQIIGLTESSLVIYRWDDGIGWQMLDNCVVDTAARTVSCTTPGFSTFVLFGTQTPVITTQQTQPASTSKKYGSNITAPAAATSTDTSPASTTITTATDTSTNTPENTQPDQGKPLVTPKASNGRMPWVITFVIAVMFLLFLFVLAKRRKQNQNA